MTPVTDLKVFWVPTDVIFLLSVPTLPILPILSGIGPTEPKLALRDDAGDVGGAGDRLEAEIKKVGILSLPTRQGLSNETTPSLWRCSSRSVQKGDTICRTTFWGSESSWGGAIAPPRSF